MRPVIVAGLVDIMMMMAMTTTMMMMVMSTVAGGPYRTEIVSKLDVLCVKTAFERYLIVSSTI